MSGVQVTVEARGVDGRAYLELDRLSRFFGGTPAVRDLSLQVAEHEIVTLLGPSGCGKTTTLRIIAGFEVPDRGKVRLKGRDVTSQSPQRRGFGMVFQHYALFPHLSVGQNVAFGLETAGLAKPEVQARVVRALERVRLPGTADRAIASLSGGQQQRVALARALAPEPAVLLLDEPLSNLDAALREQTRRELRELVKDTGITTVYVTHDQEEAFDLSDRIAVLEHGRIDQVGPAEELYHRPATEFVAGFLGRVGRVEGVAEASTSQDSLICQLADGVRWQALAPASGEPIAEGERVRLLVRPEALAFAGPDSQNALRGSVVDRRFAGSFYSFSVRVPGGTLEVQTARDAAAADQEAGLIPKAPPRGLFAFPVEGPAQG